MKFLKIPILLSTFLLFSACDQLAQADKSGGLPDLLIEKIEIMPGRSPSADFNYHEFLANVTVKNRGGDLTSDQIFLNAGNDQTNLKLENKEKALVLAADETAQFVYQILKSDNNSRQFVFQIDAGDSQQSQQNGGMVKELDEDNNFYSVQIF